MSESVTMARRTCAGADCNRPTVFDYCPNCVGAAPPRASSATRVGGFWRSRGNRAPTRSARQQERHTAFLDASCAIVEVVANEEGLCLRELGRRVDLSRFGFKPAAGASALSRWLRQGRIPGLRTERGEQYQVRVFLRGDAA